MDFLEWVDRSECLLDALDDALNFIPEVPSPQPSDLPPECWTIVTSFLQMSNIAQFVLGGSRIISGVDIFSPPKDFSRFKVA
jgi:hypothetical protein